jgi:Tol biopolymer transport system component
VARFPDCISAVNGMDWSPDGRYLVYPACSEDGVPGIFLMSMDDGGVEQITFAPQEPHPSREVMPKFSPAGDAVAYVRKTNNGDDVVGVHIQDIADGKASGEPRPLASINERNMLVYDVGWTEDGESLVWSAGDSYANTFLSVTSVASGDTRRLLAGSRARDFSIVGNLLVYMQFQDDISIWRIGGPAAAEPGVPEPWSPSTWDDDFPDYAPSGKAVVFTSDRAGTMDVYVADAEGGNLRKLTDLPFATNPEFSHDGQLIAFAAIIDEGGSRLYVIPAEGGFHRDLSEGNFREAGGGWSDDDEWIYHQSERGGGPSYEIWRVRPDGSEREQITEGGVLSPNPYGERVYFRRGGQIWSVAAGGGSEVLVLEERVGAWTVWNDKIVYMQPVAADGTEGSSASHQRVVIKVYDLETRETHEHATVTFAPGIRRRNGLTVSPDGGFILYYGDERAGSDLILVENYR